jgi:hypothetical protein
MLIISVFFQICKLRLFLFLNENDLKNDFSYSLQTSKCHENLTDVLRPWGNLERLAHPLGILNSISDCQDWLLQVFVGHPDSSSTPVQRN